MITLTAYDMTRVWEAGTRFILSLNTVLVVMLTEIISRWFTGGEWHQFSILGGIVITLGLMRIVAIRYSPSSTGGMQQTSQSGLSCS